MRLLLQTRYTGTWDDPCELTHVVVEIDPRHQLDMRARLLEVLALPQFYSMTFFDRIATTRVVRLLRRGAGVVRRRCRSSGDPG